MLPSLTTQLRTALLAVGLIGLGEHVACAQVLRNAIRELAENGLGAAPQTPHPAVVRVIVPEGEGTHSLGSGTLVDVNETNGLVLTNWHVVEAGRGPITVAFPDGFRSPAQVLGTDQDWDLAALLIRRPLVAPVSIAQQAPRPGELLSIAGYGSGNYRTASGTCTQYVSPGGQHPFEMVELSASARQGDSGGPIFNGRGELAGVLFGAGGGRTSGSYCGRVQQFLASLPAARLPVAPAAPPETTSVASRETVAPASVAIDALPGAKWNVEPAAATQPLATSTAHDVIPATTTPAQATSLEAFAPLTPAALKAEAPIPPPPTFGNVASRGEEPAPVLTDFDILRDLPWDQWFGRSRPEQAKTCLAVVGLLALIVWTRRWVNAGDDDPPPRSTKRRR